MLWVANSKFGPHVKLTMQKRKNSKPRLKKAQLSFYPEPEQYEALKQLSDRTRVPQQAYIREGLEMVLEKYKKELQR